MYIFSNFFSDFKEEIFHFNIARWQRSRQKSTGEFSGVRQWAKEAGGSPWALRPSIRPLSWLLHGLRVIIFKSKEEVPKLRATLLGLLPPFPPHTSICLESTISLLFCLQTLLRSVTPRSWDSLSALILLIQIPSVTSPWTYCLHRQWPHCADWLLFSPN